MRRYGRRFDICSDSEDEPYEPSSPEEQSPCESPDSTSDFAVDVGNVYYYYEDDDHDLIYCTCHPGGWEQDYDFNPDIVELEGALNVPIQLRRLRERREGLKVMLSNLVVSRVWRRRDELTRAAKYHSNSPRDIGVWIQPPYYVYNMSTGQCEGFRNRYGEDFLLRSDSYGLWAIHHKLGAWLLRVSLKHAPQFAAAVAYDLAAVSGVSVREFRKTHSSVRIYQTETMANRIAIARYDGR